MVKTIKQIYNTAKITDGSYNYHLFFDKNKMSDIEYNKLLKYLQPVTIILNKNKVDFYGVQQSYDFEQVIKNLKQNGTIVDTKGAIKNENKKHNQLAK